MVAAKPKAKNPPIETISGQELCALTGLSDRRHRQLAEQNYFPPPIRGQYQKQASIAGLFKYYQEQLGKKDDSLAREQHKLTKAKRERAEEELRILREQYVDKAEIAPALRNISLHQRATLQFKLENELAPNLAGLQPLEILERMRRAVDEVCVIFRDGTRAWAAAPPAEASAPATPPGPTAPQEKPDAHQPSQPA